MGDSITEYLDNATKYYKATQYEKALRACTNAIQLDPQCARAYHGRGLIQARQRRYKEAFEDYKKSCEINPKILNYMLTWESYFIFFATLKKLAHIIGWPFNWTEKFEPLYQQKTQELTKELAYAFRGRALFPAYQQVLLFNPNDDKARSQLSKLHADMGELLYARCDFEKAGSHYRLAIQRDKKFEPIYQRKTRELTKKLVRASRDHELSSAYQQVLLFNPNDDKARSQLSKLQKLEDYKKLCELNPKNAKLHADMGELLYILRDFEKVGSHYRLAIQQDKKFKSIYQQKTQELLQELIKKSGGP